MPEVVIVEAVRTPVGKRNGGLSTLHPAETLGVVKQAVLDRAGVDPAVVDQVVAGCVSQIGEQAFDIGRTAWLAAGLPKEVAAPAVLLFRLLTLWLPVLPGWLAFNHLSRKGSL